MVFGLVALLSSQAEKKHSLTAAILLGGLKGFFYCLYFVLPVFSPFSEAARIEKIESSLKAGIPDLKYLVFSFAYTLTVCALLYFLSLFALKKKRLI